MKVYLKYATGGMYLWVKRHKHRIFHIHVFGILILAFPKSGLNTVIMMKGAAGEGVGEISKITLWLPREEETDSRERLKRLHSPELDGSGRGSG